MILRETTTRFMAADRHVGVSSWSSFGLLKNHHRTGEGGTCLFGIALPSLLNNAVSRRRNRRYGCEIHYETTELAELNFTSSCNR
jgi:hypothetical protein